MKFSVGWFSLREHDEVLGRNGLKTDRPRTFVDESSRLGPHNDGFSGAPRTFWGKMKFSEHVLGAIRIGHRNRSLSIGPISNPLCRLLKNGFGKIENMLRIFRI